MLENWDQSFPNCEPIAHTLKHLLPDRWVRFHSLPLSKLYAEDEGEYRILLERHNAVLSRLFGTGTDSILLTTKFSDWPAHHGTSATLWRKVMWEEIEWEIYSEKVVWKPAVFDPIIRLAADNIASNVMVLLTHDVKTMPKFVNDRVEAGLPMPGVIEVPAICAISQVIYEIRMLGICSDEDEWEGQIIRVPL